MSHLYDEEDITEGDTSIEHNLITHYRTHLLSPKHSSRQGDR